MTPQKKVIFVTGANGYIGSHVVESLLKCGAEVIAADISCSYVPSEAKRIECDIFNTPAEELLQGKLPDACLHLAWRAGFQHGSPLHMEMLSAHYTFLSQMIRCGVKQIGVMGSMHEVGYFEGAIDENTPCKPLSLYGIAKNALRQATELLCRENDVIFQWLRGYYILGDDARNHSVFAKILEAAAAGKKEFPFVSGKKCYDFISVTGLADQIAAAIMQKEVTGIINCCSGRAENIGSIAEKFIRENGLDISLQYGVFPDRAYDSPAVWGDDTKIKTILAKRSEQ
ncbi:MAG: NAD(P)-dependent oxidoreductase [Lentisphaeria bacterium]|nr:NAD(P)-dependent oxidoreductase [Lentisphaeria bacterium]